MSDKEKGSIRIWYIHPYAGGPGVGRYWRPFSFCKNWNAKGHSAQVVTSAYHHLMEPDVARYGSHQQHGVDYSYIPTFRYKTNGIGRIASMLVFSLMLFFWGIRQAFSGNKPDLIIYSSPHPFGFVSSFLLSLILRAKLFFEVRDIWPLSVVELAGMSPRHPFIAITGWIEKFAYRYSDKVISLLPLAEPHMHEKGLASGKFCWVPNGIEHIDNVEEQPSLHPVVQHIVRLRDDGMFVLVYAGAHGTPNGLHTLVEAAVKLARDGRNDIHILLIGKGEIRQELMDLANEENLKNISFHDQVSKNIVAQVLHSASAGYISLKPEPIFRFGVSPNKLWDYMLAEIPVLFACRAGNDPVSEAQCGMSVDPEESSAVAEAIQRLAGMSVEELRQMGRRGREYVLNGYDYSVLSESVIAQYLGLK